MAKYYLPKGLTYNLIAPDYPAEALEPLKAALQQAISFEPDWAPGQAAGPVIRWFEYSHGNVGAGKAWALTQAQALAPGKPSPFFEALDNAIQDGAVLVRGGGEPTSLAYIDGAIDAEWQEPSRQALVVLAGGDVEGVPVWLVIDDIEAECPFSTDDPKETWETWGTFGDSHVPQQHGDKWYRSSCVGAQGNPMKASEWIAIYNGLNVIGVGTYQAIVAENQVVPE